MPLKMLFNAVRKSVKEFVHKPDIRTALNEKLGRDLTISERLHPTRDTAYKIFKKGTGSHGTVYDSAGLRQIPVDAQGRRIFKKGEIVIPRNEGVELVDELILAGENDNQYAQAVRKGFKDKGVRLRRRIGEEDFSTVAKSADPRVSQDGYNKVMGKYKDHIGMQMRIQEYKASFRNILDDLYDMIVKLPDEFPDFIKNIKRGQYVPTAATGRFILFTTKNIEEILGQGRGVLKDDITKHGLMPVGGFDTRSQVQAAIKGLHLKDKSVVLAQGHVDRATLEAIRTNKAYAEHIHRTMTEASYAPKSTEASDIIRAEIAFAKQGIKDLDLDSRLSKMFKGDYNNVAKKVGEGDIKLGKDRLRSMAAAEIKEMKRKGMTYSAGALPRHDIQIGRYGFRITPESIDIYLRTMHKRVAYSKIGKKWFNVIENHSVMKANPHYQDYFKSIWSRAIGEPDAAIRYLASQTQALGLNIDHVAWQRFFATTMQAQTLTKIGMNPVMPLINATQVMNSGALIEWKHVLRGYAGLMTEEGRRLAREAGFTWRMAGADTDKLTMAFQGMTHGGILETLNYYALIPFKFIELNLNRGGAYLAGLSKARSLGHKTFAEQDRIAKLLVRETQFSHGPANQPFVMGNAPMNVAFQFKGYMINQMSFIEKLATQAVMGVRTKQWHATYPFLSLMASYGVLGGAAGYPAMNYFIRRNQWMNEQAIKYPHIFRGLPSLTGYDVSRRVSIGIPDNTRDFVSFIAGPTGTTLINATKAVKEFATTGILGPNYRTFMRGISPLIRPRYSTQFSEQLGWHSVNKNGKVQMQYKTLADAWMNGYGIRSTETYLMEHAMIWMQRDIKNLENLRKAYTTEITRLLRAGDKQSQERAVLMYKQSFDVDTFTGGLGLTWEGIMRNLKTGNKPLIERFRGNVSKKDIKQLYHQHPELKKVLNSNHVMGGNL